MTEKFDRRSFLSLGAQAAVVSAGALVAHPAMAMVIPQRKPALAPAIPQQKPDIARPAGAERKISFKNIHTGDVFSGVYRVGDTYLPDAFNKINFVMRDHRSQDLFPIDPRVLDIMYQVHRATGSREPFKILSGYRCPKTNAMLRAKSGGVAKNSLHMTGQAVDVQLDNFSMRRVRDIAVALGAGGVGYYRRSNFVHMDSGAVRSW